MSGLDDIIKNANEIETLYSRFTRKQRQESTPSVIVKATGTGVDGNKIFRITKISGGTKPSNAIDGKKSTQSHGKEITADLGGVGEIRTLALKLNGGPYTFEILTSFEGKKWFRVPLGSLTSRIKTTEFQYFIFPHVLPARFLRIKSDKLLKIVMLQLLGINPDAAGGLTDQASGSVPPSGLPIPAGLETIGKPSVSFKYWGRHKTNYASGSSSGSIKMWDNTELPSTLNVLAGYEVNLGVAREKHQEGSFKLKFRGQPISYIPCITWSGKGQIGKEYPNSTASYQKIQEVAQESVGKVKGDFWVGFLAACFNDKDGMPTIMLWCKPKDAEEYVYMGKSKDTKNMKASPVLTKIDMKGNKNQVLQIRMDEVPDARIRNAFAVEIEPPE